MLVHLPCLLLLAAAADGGAATPAGEEATAEVERPRRTVELRAPEIRLLDGTFRLKLNSGWFRSAPSQDELGPRSFDMNGGLSIHDRRGRLSIAGGTGRGLHLRVEWNVRQDQDMARIHSQIDIALLGRTFTLSPPDVRLRPRFDRGQPGVEVSIPFLEGSF